MTTRVVEAIFLACCVLIAVLLFASVVKYLSSGLTDLQFTLAIFLAAFVGALHFLFNEAK
jgi:hypothetical protein